MLFAPNLGDFKPINQNSSGDCVCVWGDQEGKKDRDWSQSPWLAISSSSSLIRSRKARKQVSIFCYYNFFFLSLTGDSVVARFFNETMERAKKKKFSLCRRNCCTRRNMCVYQRVCETRHLTIKIKTPTRAAEKGRGTSITPEQTTCGEPAALLAAGSEKETGSVR